MAGESTSLIALGTRAVLAVARAGDRVSTSLSGAVSGAMAQARAERSEALVSTRSVALGIPPELYKSIASNGGEQDLIEEYLSKAGSAPRRGVTSKVRDWIGLDEDPYDPLATWGGWRERSSIIAYETLEQLGYRLGPFAGFLQTRLNQISYHSRAQVDKHGLGFVIRRKDRSKTDDDRAREIQQIIINSGSADLCDPETGERRDTLPVLMRKIVRDSLRFDQINIERKRNLKGDLLEWRAVDAKTIRRVGPMYSGKTDRGEPVRYVQIMHGQIVAEFSAKDLTFFVRNPRTSIRSWGYGESELEMMVNTVTSLLNGFSYNANFFSQGTTAKGMLTLSGLIPPRRLRHFKRLWHSMVTGTENSWRTPILNMPEEKSKAEWIDLQKSNLDMEWGKFMEWCLKVACSVWQIAPDEIGFEFGAHGQTSSLNSGNNKYKIDASKDRGLFPLLDQIARMMTEEIVEYIDPEYEFVYAGHDQESEEAEVKRRTDEGSTYKTVDEIRAECDLDELPDGKGAVILNPTWLQAAQAIDAQQGDQAEGPPDEGGAFTDLFPDEGDVGDEPDLAAAPPGALEKSLRSRPALRVVRYEISDR